MKSKLWNEMKNMTDVELNAKLAQLQDKLFKLKFRHWTAPVKNPLEIKEIRRNIARIKTLIVQKKESKIRQNNRKEQCQNVENASAV
ncbi:MAG: 50S ribosomal protein L29 [Endomicrobium sp.]|jgi:large subunit ribosomal protein L29|nr:50S ribosomal protein L29 [Endomicrobium sp.]